MRQSAALTERPLSYVVNVALHQSQILPSEAEETRLGPNVAFACWMTYLAGAALACRERFSTKILLIETVQDEVIEWLTFRLASVDGGSNMTSSKSCLPLRKFSFATAPASRSVR